MVGGAAVLAVAGVVDHQHPPPVWRGRRVGLEQPDPLLVDGLVVPGRLRQEPLQPLGLAVLGAHDWFGVGQGGQGLVAVSWQQQALQVVTQAAALRQAQKQRVEPGRVVLQRAGGGWAGAAGGHRRAPGGGQDDRQDHKSLPPLSTNYRYRGSPVPVTRTDGAPAAHWAAGAPSLSPESASFCKERSTSAAVH